MRSIFTFLLLIILFINLSFGGDNPKNVRATRTSHSPTIDGILNEEVWSSAVPATDFTQRDPLEGQPASEKTEIRVLYDDDALYFACMYYDTEPEKIVSRLGRRDMEIECDNGSIRIDSYHDHQTAFEFTFYPAGVKIDILQFDDGNHEDASWDAVWDVQTKILSNGWSAEVKIPFNILRYKTVEGDTSVHEWGINFLRYISRKQESSRWAFSPKSQSGFVSRFGHLQGLNNLHSPRKLELLPFVVAKQTYQPATYNRKRQEAFLGDAGLDMRYGITSDFNINLTINPDFGQVEADPAVLNLTTIETFLPEKRPFFIEGTQIIHFTTFGGDFGPGMFYSRRIGRAISADEVDVSGNKTITDLPSSVTILGAAKITGKTSSGLSVGILQAFTQEEKATLVDPANNTSEQVVEPFAHYNVLRMKQDFLENSNIGFIVTSVEKTGRYPALTAGTDWNIKFDNSMYQLDGFLSFTRTTTRDLDRINGSAGRATFAKIGGEHWLWSIDGDYTAKKFNINDIGFFRRPNDVGGLLSVTYMENKPAEVVRNYTIGLFTHGRQNFDNINLFKEINLGTDILFANYWNFSAGTDMDFGAYDDRETRGNGLYEKAHAYSLSGSLRTDTRRDIIVSLEQSYRWDSKQYQRYSTSLGLMIIPVSWMSYELQTAVNRARNQEAWVDTMGIGGNIVNIFGDRSTDDISFTLKSNLTFTRDLTLQLYGQVFLAKGHYENYRQLVGTSDFIQTQYSGNNDFNSTMWNSNVVLRWEYLPGSTLYFVWSQSRHDNISDYFRSFGGDFNGTFQTPPANVLLLKASYYWNL